MKNIKTMGFIICLILLILSNPSICILAESEQINLQEVGVSISQLKKGITIVLLRNSEGIYNQYVYDEDSDNNKNIDDIQTRATADGILEWAEFHLGFVDWNDNTNRLYFTISSDEPMYDVYGHAYVKTISPFPTYYFNSDFYERLYGSCNTSRVLEEALDTGNSVVVLVGFTYAYMNTIGGDEADFSSGAQLVQVP